MVKNYGPQMITASWMIPYSKTNNILNYFGHVDSVSNGKRI